MAAFPGRAHIDDSSSDSDDSDSSASTVAVDSQYRLTDRNPQRQQFGNRPVANNQSTGASRVTVSSIASPVRETRRPPIIHDSSSNSGNTRGTSTLVRPRTGTNRIDINNNPSSSATSATVATNTGSSTSSNSRPAVPQVANSIRREALNTDEAINRQDPLMDDTTSASTQVDLQETMMMPRASSAFQTALEQLPPISAASSVCMPIYTYSEQC